MEQDKKNIFQEIFDHIQNVWQNTKGLSGKELEATLIKSAQTEEETQLIEQMCQDVDTYYEKRADFRSSKKTPGEWLEQEIENTVTELCPEADAYDIKEVKQSVSKAIDSEIEVTMKCINEEIAPVGKELENNNNL